MTFSNEAHTEILSQLEPKQQNQVYKFLLSNHTNSADVFAKLALSLQLDLSRLNAPVWHSTSDVGWYQFRVWLEYFAAKFGKVTVAVPPHYTSQECSNCGRVVKKSLSTRTHTCHCGCQLDRDENAAINILKKGLITLGHSEIHAWGEETATQIGQVLSEQVTSQNQESPH